MSKPSLGRGLAALLPQSDTMYDSEALERDRTNRVIKVSVEQIHPNTSQPRKNFDEANLSELSNSIREHGILQPILVRRLGAFYEIIAGERRWRAAKMAGIKEIDVIVKDLETLKAYEAALIENLQREDLNPIETAHAYEHLIKTYNYTQEQLAQRLGKDRSTITNILRLLKLPKSVHEHIINGKLSMGHARALLACEDEATITKLAQRLIELELSVRDTEELIKQLKKPSQNKKVHQQKTWVQAFPDLHRRLQETLGTKIHIQQKAENGPGKIEILFHSNEELKRIIDKIPLT